MHKNRLSDVQRKVEFIAFYERTTWLSESIIFMVFIKELR